MKNATRLKILQKNICYSRKPRTIRYKLGYRPDMGKLVYMKWITYSAEKLAMLRREREEFTKKYNPLFGV